MVQIGSTVHLSIVVVGYLVGVQVQGMGIYCNVVLEWGEQCAVEFLYLTVSLRVIRGCEKGFHIQCSAIILKEA